MARRLSLGPGGKALMILAGLGLIGLGLWYAGVISPEPETEDPGVVFVDPEPKVGESLATKVEPADEEQLIEEPGEPRPGPSAPEDDPSPAQPESPRVAEPTVPPPERQAPASPPPLFAASESRLRVSKTVEPGGAPELLRDLANGTTDIVEIDLLDLVELAAHARGTVVIGARGASRPLYLCAEVDPIESIRPGARVAVERSSQRLAVGHVAEARGVGVTGLSWVAVSADFDLIVSGHEPEHLACVSLAAIGATGPTLLLARREDVMVYGKSYSEASRNLGGGDERARGYLVAPDESFGYRRQAAYAAGLSARLSGAPLVSAPEVAGWIIDGATR